MGTRGHSFAAVILAALSTFHFLVFNLRI